jgi:1-phosphofructokinase family hexose kinase
MITVLLLSPSLDVTYRVSSVRVGEIHRPREVLRFPGGKGLNLARAATRLGAEVRVIAPLGGFLGELVLSLATEAGVHMISVPSEAETRSCVTVADDGGALTEFYEPASSVDATALAALESEAGRLDASGWTVLSGSVPSDVPLDRLIGMLRSRAQAGDRIAIDTHGAALETLLASLNPDLVKVNRLEARDLLAAADDASALDLALALRERSGGTVIVTDGADGSVAVDAVGEWRATLDADPGRFAVGSGDSYLGGILTVFDRGGTLDEALAVATGAAAANAAVPGAGEFAPELATSLAARTSVDPA